MDVFLVVGLSAALFLALELRLSGREEPAADGDAPLEWALFSHAYLRRRLAALAAELDRLDHDPDIFAKAHHFHAARSAYEALLADVSRLGVQPMGAAQVVGAVVSAEPAVVRRGVGEVLEL
jgi:uncharacterized small protein (DUF1192 family)